MIIKRADAIERGHQVTDAVFDKNGAITGGDLYVVHERLFSHPKLSTDGIFSLGRSVTNNNEHPVSRTVGAAMQKKPGNFIELENLESILALASSASGEDPF